MAEFTFLFTDIEGSTRMWEHNAATMSSVLARHDVILREAISAHNGKVFKTIGDAFCAVFANPLDALESTVDAQKALRAQNLSLRVRMALHTGSAEERDNDYFGSTLNRVARILSAAHGEQILLSGAAREALAGDLPYGVELRDLGTHRLRDVSESVHIFHVIAPDIAMNFSPIKSLTPRPTNLPASLTSFIAREREIAEISARLRRARLITLTGTGGIGKTRLALQIAETLRDEFEHGVFFVALGPITQPDLVPDAVARALGVEEREGESLLQMLKTYLRDRHMLLVFDNFEQILDAAPIVNTLLAASPGLKALVTSREALFIYGEQTCVIEPLAAPGEREKINDWHRFPSMTLFIERVLASQPDFALTPTNLNDVGEICRRLDGLPLAIELAAARIRQLSLADIVSQLTARLALLSSGPRDLPKRQQTIRGAIDWSVELLSSDEQKLFARLAVFTGGFTDEAAAAVAGSSDLEKLISASLVRRGDAHFEILEVLREYALERLTHSGDLLDAQQRHAAYYRDYLEDVAQYLAGAEAGRWFSDLDVAHHNLRTALEWALEQNQYDTAGRIAGVLWRLWVVYSHLEEGHQRFAQVLRIQDHLSVPLRAKILHGAGRLEFFRSNFTESETLLNASLEFYREVADLRGQATCLLELGEIKTMQANYIDAERLFAECLALGDEGTKARLLDNLGSIAGLLGNYSDAELFYREGLELQRSAGRPEPLANVLNNLAEMLRAQGKYAEAIAFYQESLTFFRQLEFPFGIGTLLLNIAAVERDQRNYQRAHDLFREALSLLRDLDEVNLILSGLIGVASVLICKGEAKRAARLSAAIEEIMRSGEYQLDQADQDEYDHVNRSINARLGESARSAAFAEGRVMSMEQVLAYALDG